MRCREANVLTSTCAARTAVSSSSRRANSGTSRKISGEHGIGVLHKSHWDNHSPVESRRPCRRSRRDATVPDPTMVFRAWRAAGQNTDSPRIFGTRPPYGQNRVSAPELFSEERIECRRRRLIALTHSRCRTPCSRGGYCSTRSRSLGPPSRSRRTCRPR